MVELYHDDEIFTMPERGEPLVIEPHPGVVDTSDHVIRCLQRLWNQVVKGLQLLVFREHMEPTLWRQLDRVPKRITETSGRLHAVLIPFQRSTHNGGVALESHPGQGTTVTLRLPLFETS